MHSEKGIERENQKQRIMNMISYILFEKEGIALDAVPPAIRKQLEREVEELIAGPRAAQAGEVKFGSTAEAIKQSLSGLGLAADLSEIARTIEQIVANKEED